MELARNQEIPITSSPCHLTQLLFPFKALLALWKRVPVSWSTCNLSDLEFRFRISVGDSCLTILDVNALLFYLKKETVP